MAVLWEGREGQGSGAEEQRWAGQPERVTKEVREATEPRVPAGGGSGGMEQVERGRA